MLTSAQPVEKGPYYVFVLANGVYHIEDANSSNPAGMTSNIDPTKLNIHGGHAWQGAKLGKLDAQYVYDMRTLIERIGKGTAEIESMSSFVKFLDTNFKFGTATISWNKEAAAKYAVSVRSKRDPN